MSDVSFDLNRLNRHQSKSIVELFVLPGMEFGIAALRLGLSLSSINFLTSFF